MPFPLAAALVLAALGQGVSSAMSSHNQRKQQDAQNRINEEQVGVQESALNPFRGANAQSTALSGIDRQLNTTPRSKGVNPNGYATATGGQYSMSPEMTQFLQGLRDRIGSGAAANPAISQSYRGAQPNLNATGAAVNPGTGPAVPLLPDGRTPDPRYSYDPTTGQWTYKVG